MRIVARLYDARGRDSLKIGAICNMKETKDAIEIQVGTGWSGKDKCESFSV